MTYSVQVDSELQAIATMLNECHRIAICGHVSPDGDCIGSQLALQLALESQGKEAVCLLVKDEPIDKALAFMPGSDRLVPASDATGSFDAFVAVDVPTRERLGEAACAIMDAAPCVAVIDHHDAGDPLCDLHCIRPNSPSTTMLIWDLAGIMGAQMVPGVAQCCFTGLVTDTGRFQFQNSTKDAFAAAAQMVQAGADPAFVSREVFQNRSLASLELEKLVIERMTFDAWGTCAVSWLTQEDFDACGAVKADAEPLVNVIRSIRGVRAVCLLREQDGAIRGGLRAKDDTDVSQIARSFGGGGHKAAAGFTLHCEIQEARDCVLSALSKAVFSNCETMGDC